MRLLLIILTLSYFERIHLPSFPTEKLRNYINLNLKIPKARRVIETEYEFINDSAIINRLRPPKEYIFNKGGILNRINIIDPKANTVFSSYGFDKAGRILFQIRNHDFIKYEYDEKRRISKELWFYKDSTLIETAVAIYNQNGKLIRKEIYRKDSKLSRYFTYDYNEQGDLVKETFINTRNGPGVTADSSLTGGKSEFTPWSNDTTRYIYSYEDTVTVQRSKRKGVVDKVTKSFTVSDTSLFQEFKMDLKCKCLKKEFERKTIRNLKTEEYIVFTKHTYFYKDDVLEKYINESSEGSIKIEHYDYQKTTDVKGNWTSITTLVNGEKKKKVERIIYYE